MWLATLLLRRQRRGLPVEVGDVGQRRWAAVVTTDNISSTFGTRGERPRRSLLLLLLLEGTVVELRLWQHGRVGAF